MVAAVVPMGEERRELVPGMELGCSVGSSVGHSVRCSEGRSLRCSVRCSVGCSVGGSGEPMSVRFLEGALEDKGLGPWGDESGDLSVECVDDVCESGERELAKDAKGDIGGV